METGITSYFRFLFCGILLLLLGLPAQGNVYSDGGIENPAFRDVSFVDAVKEISQRFNVFFTFDLELVEGITVDDAFRHINDVENAVEYVLHKTDLNYRIIDTRYVIIYKNDQEGINSLKEMSRHLDGLIHEGESGIPISAKRDIRMVPRLPMSLSSKAIDRIAFTVNGTVTDQEGEPLIGVNIQVKDSSKGTATDFDGRFTLEDIDENAVLVISYVGYQTQEVAVAGKSNLEIVMTSDSQMLDEVVVVGYGTVNKRSVTSAISKVENKILDQIPAGRPESALVGRMAGVNISQVRSSPGSAPSISIRGPGSISASNSPLVVIDGFPGASFDQVNMNDVESIEVLKDASSAAIYGSRGSGGVIIITTKSGKEGKPSLNFNSYAGISQPILHGRKNWIEGGQEFYDYTARYINRDFAWTGGDPSLPLWGDERRPAQYRVNPVISEGDWNWEEILIKPAPIQNYNLSVSGKSSNTDYYVSGTYKDEQGNILNTGYKQYSLRANVNVDINSRIRAGIMINPNYTDRRTYPGGLQNLVKMPPFLSPNKRESGKYPKPTDYWGTTVSAGVSPLATIYGTHNYRTSFNTLGETYLGINILKSLKFRSSFGFTMAYATVDNFQESTTTSTGLTSGNGQDARNFNLLNENILSYDVSFSDIHDVNAILGASYQYNLSRSSILNVQSGSFANDIIPTLNNALIDPNSYTSKSHWGLASYFTRANYGFNGKYLFSASLRADGSSRFGIDNRWGYFPSGSLAWRISEENFFDNSKKVNEFKIRASYGAVGNYNIGDFQYLGSIGNANYSPGGKLTQGQAQSSFSNSELKWERTESFDVGMDVSLFDNRFSFTLDLYRKLTKDLLYNVTIPAISGFTSTLVNIGDIRNKGIEVELHTRNLIGDFTWQTSYNFTRNINKVMAIGDGIDEVVNTHSRGMAWLLKVGEPMFSYYGYRQIGVIQYARELEEVPIMSGQRVGTVKYDDVNNDGEITPEDRVVLGSFMPKFYMGMVNDFSWKNFDFSIALQASFGAKRYNLENLYYQGATVSAFLKPIVENQWWSEEQPGDGKHPATSLAALEYVGNSDYYLENASFIAIRNINFGYDLPNRFLNQIDMNKLRLYFSISNPFMFTSNEYNGYNPEGYTSSGISGISSQPGLNNGTEPIPRIFVLGLNLNF